MTSTLKTFNNQLISFSKTLTTRFPENKDLSLGLTGIEALNSCNPKKNIELFTFYVYKYRDRILSKDQTLLETDFVTEHSLEDAENGFDIMKNLRLNWKMLDDNERENIWKYLQVLIKITDKYTAETMSKSI